MKRMTPRRFFGVFLAAAFSVAGSASAQDDAPKNLLDVAKDSSSLGTFVKLVKAAGLETLLTGSKKYTVFAPNDEAFGYAPKRELEAMLSGEDKAAAEAAVKLHILSGNRASSSLKEGEIASLAGTKIFLFVEEGDISYASGVVVEKDLTASNGVIHIIDSVVRTYSDDD